MIEKITTSPSSIKRLKQACNPAEIRTIKSYSPDEALALLVDLKLTKDQYIKLQKGAIERNINLYPPYYVLLKEKVAAYPEQN